MREDFSKVTPKMLAQLFPIILSEHKPEWKLSYNTEKEFLINILGDKIIRINHYGSTSVKGLIAKPTIDILLEVSEDTDIQALTEIMLDEGFVINNSEKDIIIYLKGYTPRGFAGQAYHIHVRHSGDWDELYFRDYLIAHPRIAAAYAKLKCGLKERFEFDRDGYTAAKSGFIAKYTQQAKAEFPNRYMLKNNE